MRLILAYDDLVNAFRLWNIWTVEHPDDVDPPDDSKQCAIEQADLLLHYLSLAEQL